MGWEKKQLKKMPVNCQPYIYFERGSNAFQTKRGDTGGNTITSDTAPPSPHLNVFVAVHRVIGPHHLPNGVHGQLRRPDVDRPDTGQGREGGTDRAPAAGVVLHLRSA